MDKKKLLKKMITPIISLAVFVIFILISDVLLSNIYKISYYKVSSIDELRNLKNKPGKNLFDELESKSLDTFMMIRTSFSKSRSGESYTKRTLSPLVSEDICIVAIDENSLFKIGRWPFKRFVHGELADYFTRQKHRENTLFYDIFFVEPDLYNPEYDASFIDSMKNNGRVVVDFIARDTIYKDREEETDLKNRVRFMEEKFGTLKNVSGNFNRVKEFTALTLPLKPYQDSIVNMGYANTVEDSDKIVRRYPLVSRYREWNEKLFKDIQVNSYHDIFGVRVFSIDSYGDNHYILKPDTIILMDQSATPVNKRTPLTKEHLDLMKNQIDKYSAEFMLDIMKLRGRIDALNLKAIQEMHKHLTSSALSDDDKIQFKEAIESISSKKNFDMYGFINDIIIAIEPFAKSDEIWNKELKFYKKLLGSVIRIDNRAVEIKVNNTTNKYNLYSMAYHDIKPEFEVIVTENHYFIKSIPLALMTRYFHIDNDNVEVILGKSIKLHKPLVINPKTNKLEKPIIKGKPADSIIIPLDNFSNMLINFAGAKSTSNRDKRTTFDVYSYSEFLDPDKQILVKNKMMLVGAFSHGMADDQYQSPMKSMFGIEIIANALNTTVKNDFIVILPKWLYYIILFIMTLLVGYIASTKNILRGSIYTVAFLALYFILSSAIFSLFNIALEVPRVISISMLSLAAVFVYRILTEEKQKKQIKGIFSKYVNSSVVEQLILNPPKLGGEDKELTVQFSDIRGFTTLSERLTPQQLVEVLNTYLTAMTDIIMENDGTLDKYIGDAIMCFWGAPVDNQNNPTVACRAALYQMDKLKEINQSLSPETQLDIGIGLNTGIMTVGNMGSEGRMNYTVMGDSVNLASRLEGINKFYGTNIIISEFTYEKIKSDFFCRELDEIKVKGKLKPVKIYELLGEIKELREHGIL